MELLHSRTILLLSFYHRIEVHPSPWKKLLSERVILSKLDRKASLLQEEQREFSKQHLPIQNR